MDDDFKARRIVKDFLSPYGDCDTVVNGEEAIEAFILGWDQKQPYDLICMDIMMPDMDGQQALKRIREIEEKIGLNITNEVKVIMITALDDFKNVMQAYSKGYATAYLVKPIDKETLINTLHQMNLMG